MIPKESIYRVFVEGGVTRIAPIKSAFASDFQGPDGETATVVPLTEDAPAHEEEPKALEGELVDEEEDWAKS